VSKSCLPLEREAKGRIVAESYAPGAIVSQVARRHDISPQHLFAWRKAARGGALSLPAEGRHGSSPPLVSRRHDNADRDSVSLLPKCQLYRRLYIRTNLCKMDRLLQVSPVAT
jgi:transposase-like protein